MEALEEEDWEGHGHAVCSPIPVYCSSFFQVSWVILSNAGPEHNKSSYFCFEPSVPLVDNWQGGASGPPEFLLGGPQSN